MVEPKAEVGLFKKQKTRAEHLAERVDKKIVILDMLVDMAENEYDVQIRKNYTPKLFNIVKNKTKKRWFLTLIYPCTIDNSIIER
jgi:hypothetical protein